MKKMLSLLLVLLTIVSILVVPVSASAKASNIISTTDITVTTKPGGYLQTTYEILGTRVMDLLGAKKVEIYENDGNGWSIVKTYDYEDDPNMLTTNRFSYSYTMPTRYKGVTGYSYYVNVTFYAEDFGVETDTISQSSPVVIAE